MKFPALISTALLWASSATALRATPGGDLNYTSIYPSDCPCNRKWLKYCTVFKRENIDEAKNYNVRRPAKSLRIDSPWVSEAHPILCRVTDKIGPAGWPTIWTAGFTDNHMCVEPVKDGDKLFETIACFRTTPEDLKAARLRHEQVGPGGMLNTSSIMVTEYDDKVDDKE